MQTNFTQFNPNFPITSESQPHKEPEFEYYKIEVYKSLFTDLYLKVIKGTKLKPRILNYKLLKKIIDETGLEDYDWEDSEQYEWIGTQKVEEKEAERFEIFELKNEN